MKKLYDAETGLTCTGTSTDSGPQPGKVSCHITVDNKMTSLKYNGETVQFTGGDGSDWTKTKRFSFFPVAGGKIEVGAMEY